MRSPAWSSSVGDEWPLCNPSTSKAIPAREVAHTVTMDSSRARKEMMGARPTISKFPDPDY